MNKYEQYKGACKASPKLGVKLPLESTWVRKTVWSSFCFRCPICILTFDFVMSFDKTEAH
jgi:hypothetical protein